uniref:Uncharacterized protein n=1 Tax=Solanum lycopersicum TaxID=4081 RepID=K4BH09_SOLLC
MVIEIPLGKGRPVKAAQLSKLSNELGIIARNCLAVQNKWKELTTKEKDFALFRFNVQNWDTQKVLVIVQNLILLEQLK